MANILDNLKYQFKSGGMFIKLIFINVAVFVFFNLIATIAALMKWDDLFITFSNGSIFIPTQWFSFSTDPELLHYKTLDYFYLYVYAWRVHALANEYAHILLYGKNAGAISRNKKNVEYLRSRRHIVVL